MMTWFKDKFSYFYHRKLRLDILTLFLLLITLTTAFIITYSYIRNSRAITRLSSVIIEQVSALINEKTKDLVTELEIVPQIASSQLLDLKDVSFENKALISFLLTSVKIYPDLHALLIGTENGNFIEAVDLTKINHNFYLSDISKALPPGILYAIRTIDRTVTPPVEKWEYKDGNFNTIETETVKRVAFDPREKTWYQGAKSSHKLFWADNYVYDPTQDRGIAVAQPLYDKDGKFLGVVAADLSLKTLHYFLSKIQIGKNGKAFLLSNSGKILVPKEVVARKGITEKTVKSAFQKFQSEQKEDFQFESEGEKYLVSVDPFPVPFEKPWYTLSIVPTNDFLGDLLRTQVEIGVFSLLMLLLAAILVIYFSKRISRPIVQLTGEVDKIKRLELESPSRVRSNIREIVQLDQAISSSKVMLKSFGRYVPKAIVHDLFEQGKEIELGGEKKEITLLFTDIASFTPIAEGLSPDVLMPPLSEYYTLISNSVLQEEGTIDKYLGDGMMAFWGAPKEVSHPEEKACLAVLKCKAKLGVLNKKNKENDLPVFNTRFGINTGVAIVGNVGTQERMNYTAMGDAVNTAARLEQVNKVYGTTIMIGEATQSKISNNFVTRPIDFIAMKGKTTQVKIYELIGCIEAEEEIKVSKEDLELAEAFTRAYDAFHSGNSSSAKALFLQIQAKFPNDPPTKFYLEKYLKNT